MKIDRHSGNWEEGPSELAVQVRPTFSLTCNIIHTSEIWVDSINAIIPCASKGFKLQTYSFFSPWSTSESIYTKLWCFRLFTQILMSLYIILYLASYLLSRLDRLLLTVYVSRALQLADSKKLAKCVLVNHQYDRLWNPVLRIRSYICRQHVLRLSQRRLLLLSLNESLLNPSELLSSHTLYYIIV